jgi:hypothetical protein
MNVEQLQLINRNQTSDTLLHLFANSKQVSNETNLETFYKFLINKGNAINQIDFRNFFRDLEAADVGVLHDNKFTWKFSLQDISEQILNPNKMVNIRPSNIKEEEWTFMEQEVKRRGRPKGSKNRPQLNTVIMPQENQQAIVEQQPTIIKRRGRPKGIRQQAPSKEIIFMFTTSKGRVIPFNLDDADKLIKQVEEVKSQLTG